MRCWRVKIFALLLSLLVCTFAEAADLPQAELRQVEPGFVADESTSGAPEPGFIEIHSQGQSRFEIGDDGNIVVVYSGGVEFSYLGYKLRASELRFDQAARSANVAGDVRFESPGFVFNTQQIALDGSAGRAAIVGHLVGSLTESGIRFEADSAQLSFPPESDQPRPEESQLTLTGSVVVFSQDGAELRTDQVALNGATRRFSSAPFTLVIPMQGKEGQAPQTVQVKGTAFGGMLTEKGELAQIDVLGLLAVSRLGRISAARAEAHPDPVSQSWKVAISGSPVRMEYDAPLLMPVRKQQRDVGPLLLESLEATLEIDKEGLRAAGLSGGTTLAVAGNRLTVDSVSMSRRADGMALSLDGLSLGLDLQHLTGIEPVDLSELIK